jgi:tetratricopeptide (TPR) repeat protein
MKYIFLAFISLITLSSLGQQITYQQWQEEAKTNINLLPEYGNAQKTKEQVDVDNEFINSTLKIDTTHRKASDHLVRLGFIYFYRGDLETAMKRFNQAWLLDNTNANAYWGFGAIYMTFGDQQSALKQYDKGLAINPQSTNILTDKATIYMVNFEKGGSADNVTKALELFNKSYSIDAANQNTLFKLSICYFLNSDCTNAMKYYDACKKLGGQPITQDYTNALMQKCNK